MLRPSAFRPEVRRALPAMIGLRFVATTARRMVFSFIPAITSGTGLSIEQMGQVLFVRDLTGLAAGKVGRLTDRFGRSRSIVVGGGILGVGLLLALQGAVGLVIGLIIFGFGNLGVIVGMNTWIADEVAYERRGQATGLFEMTWAGSALIGIPMCGVLIDLVGWRSVFLVLGLASLTVTLFQRPPAARISREMTNETYSPTFDLNAVSTLLAPAILIGAASFLVFGHGSWLDELYGLSASRVGLALVAVGAVEALGSFGSSRFTDRLGKKRSVLLGSTLMLMAICPLVLMDAPPLITGLGSLMVAFGGFEFAIVSSLPLAAEIDPGARAYMIGWSVGLQTAAGAVVFLVAGFLDQRHGFSVLASVAGCLVVTAMLIMWIGVSEPLPTPSDTPR